MYMLFTAGRKWKSIPYLWQINLGEINKHKNHCWQVPLLSRLVLLRSAQQHGDFGDKATSESLFPPQSPSSAVNRIQPSSWETDAGWEKNPTSFFFFLYWFNFFCKGSVVSRAQIHPWSTGVGTKRGSIPRCRGWRGFAGLPKPKSQPQLHPTVPVRNPLLIRRISKKISERDKKTKSNPQISAPGMLEAPSSFKVGCLSGSYLG